MIGKTTRRLLEVVDGVNDQVPPESLDQREEVFRAQLSKALESIPDSERREFDDAYSQLIARLRSTDHIHEVFLATRSGGGDDAFWDFCSWIVSRGSGAVAAAFAGSADLRKILPEWDEGYYGEWMCFAPDTDDN